MKKTLIFLLTLIASLKLSAQCDTIYSANNADALDAKPEFKDGDLGKKYNDELVSYIRGNCEKDNKHYVDHKIGVIYIIDSNGIIQETTLYKYDFDESCRNYVLEWFESIGDFSPGIKNGIPVCSEMLIVLNARIFESN